MRVQLVMHLHLNVVVQSLCKSSITYTKKVAFVGKDVKFFGSFNLLHGCNLLWYGDRITP